MRVIVGSDHGGLRLKRALVAHLKGKGVDIEDVGTHDESSTDYPDHARPVAEAVRDGEADWGLLVCGTGIGMSLAANKVRGVRAAVVSDTFSAEMTRRHNNANVLCVGERVIGEGLACRIVDAFLAASFDGGRHERRVNKIMALEETA